MGRCNSCASSTRPYLRKSVEEGRDLSGAELPTVTTISTYNNYGDPTQIVATTTGTFANATRTYAKTTTNTFCEPGTAGCPNNIADNNWILGRLTRSSVTNSVPNLLPALTASAGSSSTATATQGIPPAGTVQPINPAVLAAILQLLLED